MSEKRFILDSDFVKVTSQVVWDNQEEKGLTLMKLVELLNELSDENEKLRFLIDINSVSERKKLERQVDEQQATIEHLTKSRDKWSKSAKLHSEYFDCLEKAIEIAYEEKPYPKIEDIRTIYSKLEKEINDE